MTMTVTDFHSDGNSAHWLSATSNVSGIVSRGSRRVANFPILWWPPWSSTPFYIDFIRWISDFECAISVFKVRSDALVPMLWNTIASQTLRALRGNRWAGWRDSTSGLLFRILPLENLKIWAT